VSWCWACTKSRLLVMPPAKCSGGAQGPIALHLNNQGAPAERNVVWWVGFTFRSLTERETSATGSFHRTFWLLRSSGLAHQRWTLRTKPAKAQEHEMSPIRHTASLVLFVFLGPKKFFVADVDFCKVHASYS